MRCVAGGDRHHLQDKVEDGQTAGKQHKLQHSSHCQQEDRLCGGSTCAASETGGNTVHTWDRRIRRAVGTGDDDNASAPAGRL